MIYLGEPSVTTRVFIRQRVRVRGDDVSKEAGAEGERSEDATPLALKMEDAP